MNEIRTMGASDQILCRETSAPPHSADIGASRTVLFVDDEPSILSALRRLFRKEDMIVLTASDGERALHVLVGWIFSPPRKFLESCRGLVE